jgi:hypothetical protein
MNKGPQLKYFILDIDFEGCKMVTQSRLLTGILTGIGKWDGRGDAPSADRRSGKPLSGTPGAEAERLSQGRPKGGLGSTG